MVTVIVAVIDEGTDLPFQVTGPVVVFQEHAVFRGLMPPLDLVLRLRMVRRTANMIHTLVFVACPRLVVYCL